MVNKRIPLSPDPRSTGWPTRFPIWAHATPYVGLALLGGVLLLPGVVPAPGCGETIATVAGNSHAFIQISALAFGMVAWLLLLSAVVASAQRRSGRPGWPTLIGGGLFGAITTVAMLSPHGSSAVPAQAVMAIVFLGLLVTRGAGLAVPMVAAAVAAKCLGGPRRLRRLQIAAWTVLLLGLPLIAAATYLTATPLCWD